MPRTIARPGQRLAAFVAVARPVDRREIARVADRSRRPAARRRRRARAGMHAAVAIGEVGGAVEHQFVLAADHVEVGDAPRRTRARAAPAARRAAPTCRARRARRSAPAAAARRPRRSRASGSANHRSSQISRPTLHAVRPRTRRRSSSAAEIAALVEHRVVGQLALAVGRSIAPSRSTLAALYTTAPGRLRPADHGDDARARCAATSSIAAAQSARKAGRSSRSSGG